ncbi:MAG: hypothetical protein OXU66_11520 [Gammaproteobacteria bacterium]|nr:hypothetical protein [Gammaproteobacteria bacterium]MDD9896702.1 hypothetical protein [Gammaproteobacteria bacterium]MDD9959558.1 hypothetical protein [Gammaproteobacteria bacterium]
MAISQAVAIAERAGFGAASSNLLHNPDDDYRRSIFARRLARNADRFLLQLNKP